MGLVQNLLGACVLMMSVGCHRSEPRWGGAFGNRAIPGDHEVFLNFALQGDLFSGTFDPSKERPLFVILWKGSGADRAEQDGDNRFTSINGHRLSVSFTNRAVYALQPDYSLRDLRFSEPDLSRVLNAIAHRAPIEGDLWTNRLSPKLCVLHR